VQSIPHRKRISTLSLGLALAIAPAPLLASQTSEPRDALAHEFGATGLTADLNSEEIFGAVQARLGAYSTLSPGQTAHSLDLWNTVVPTHVTAPIGQDGHWFVKLGAAQVWATAADHGTRLADTAGTNSLAQIQYRPWAGTLIGLGATYESNIVHLANGGRILNTGPGLRLDLLQRFDDHGGLVVKLSWMDGRTDIVVPVGNGLRLANHTQSPRLYGQAGLDGKFTTRDARWIPAGWSLRPAVHVVAQRNIDAASVNSFGHAMPRDVQDYAQIIITAKLQSDPRSPGHLAPFVELGQELRVAERAATPSEPAMAYARAGATLRLGKWGFFDAYVAHHDSLDGRMKANVAECLISATL
jgi:hypothetical protein